jgi:hypothetical protein
VNYLSGLASNHHPPDLSLPGSWNDRRELPAPSFIELTCISVPVIFTLTEKQLEF